jgi:release factor glutamine methyltransferase
LTVSEAVALAGERLAAASVEEPRREARVLVRLALGGAGGRELDPGADLSPPEEARLIGLIARRSRREPAAYLRGTAEFRSLDFEVGPSVLIPRPETELLVEEAAAFLAGRAGGRLRAVDMGTGSGCIAVSLALAEPRAVVHAVDCSHPALRVAQRNVARHGVERRVRLVHGSFWNAPLPAALRGHVDAVVCNPPYVDPEDFQRLAPEIRAWEPAVALVAEQGFRAVFAEVASGALPWLAPGGLLAFEVGVGQADAVRDIVRRLGYRDVRLRPDYAGIDRVVLARKPAPGAESAPGDAAAGRPAPPPPASPAADPRGRSR